MPHPPVVQFSRQTVREQSARLRIAIAIVRGVEQQGTEASGGSAAVGRHDQQRVEHKAQLHCRLLRLSLELWASPLLPPPEMLLLHAPRSVRAARCLWSSQSAVIPSALGWSKV